jgi:hypothetical protein
MYEEMATHERVELEAVGVSASNLLLTLASKFRYTQTGLKITNFTVVHSDGDKSNTIRCCATFVGARSAEEADVRILAGRNRVGFDSFEHVLVKAIVDARPQIQAKAVRAAMLRNGTAVVLHGHTGRLGVAAAVLKCLDTEDYSLSFGESEIFILIGANGVLVDQEREGGDQREEGGVH